MISSWSAEWHLQLLQLYILVPFKYVLNGLPIICGQRCQGRNSDMLVVKNVGLLVPKRKYTQCARSASSNLRWKQVLILEQDASSSSSKSAWRSSHHLELLSEVFAVLTHTSCWAHITLVHGLTWPLHVLQPQLTSRRFAGRHSINYSEATHESTHWLQHMHKSQVCWCVQLSLHAAETQGQQHAQLLPFLSCVTNAVKSCWTG